MFCSIACSLNLFSGVSNVDDLFSGGMLVVWLDETRLTMHEDAAQEILDTLDKWEKKRNAAYFLLENEKLKRGSNKLGFRLCYKGDVYQVAKKRIEALRAACRKAVAGEVEEFCLGYRFIALKTTLVKVTAVYCEAGLIETRLARQNDPLGLAPEGFFLVSDRKNLCENTLISQRGTAYEVLHL